MMYSRARITDTLPPTASPMDIAGFRWPPAMNTVMSDASWAIAKSSQCMPGEGHAPENDAAQYTRTKIENPKDSAMVSSRGSSSAHCPNTAVDHGVTVRDAVVPCCKGVTLVHSTLLFLH